MPREHDHDRLYSITELADELNMTARAIRFYEAKDLLAPQRAGGNRVYTHRDRARLMIIQRGKRLGFSLARIKQYLDLYDADPTHKKQLVHLLAGARQRIDELQSQRRDLDLTLEELREIEEQVLAATLYVLVNPVQARLCRHPSEWPWGSYRDAVELRPTLVPTATLLGLLSPDPRTARARLAELIDERVAHIVEEERRRALGR